MAGLTFERPELGVYRAVVDDGTVWRIVQAASRRWDLYRDSTLFHSVVTLADAKWHANDVQSGECDRRRARRAV